MASCAKCGADLIGVAKFCSACGAPVAAASPAPPPAKRGTELMPSRPAAPPASSRPPPSAAPAADPFAQTAFAGGSGAYGPPPAPIGSLPGASTSSSASGGAAPAAQPALSSPVGVSPLASSGVVPPSSRSVPFPRAQPPPPAGPAPQAYPAKPAAGPYASNPHNPALARGAQGAGNWGGGPRPAPNAFAPGARVLVQWADGKRYPGTVKQAAGGQSLVVFDDGQQRWIDVAYLSPGR